MLRKNKSLIDRAVDSASDAVDAALPVIENAVTTALEQVKEIAQETKTKSAPLIADTKVLAGEIAEATREVAVPKAKTAAAASIAGAAELAASGRDIAAAKVAEVKAEPPKRKGRRMRRLLVFGALAAAAGFAYNKMRSSAQADNWQSTYTPPAPADASGSATSATTSATTSAPATGGTHLAPGVGPDEPLATDDPMAKHAADLEADDPAGATPGEAIADAAEEPHEPSTPDEPAEAVDVKKK